MEIQSKLHCRKGRTSLELLIGGAMTGGNHLEDLEIAFAHLGVQRLARRKC